MSVGKYDALLRAHDGDVRRVVVNYILPEGPCPEGWRWANEHLDQIPLAEVLELLHRFRSTKSESLTEGTLICAVAARCPLPESAQRSYTSELARAADRLPREVWDELLTQLRGRLSPPCWVGLLGAVKVECCEEYERLRATLPRWSTLQLFLSSVGPSKVREGGPEHPAVTLFDDRNDPNAPSRRLGGLLRGANIEYRAHVLATLENAKLLPCLSPEDALPADYRFARRWGEEAGEESDDRHGSRAFFVGFAWRWAQAGEQAATEWFFRQAADRALRAGSWDAIQSDLGPWVERPEDRERIERDVIERGVPEGWVNPGPWSVLFDYARGRAASHRYRWLDGVVLKVAKGLLDDSEAQAASFNPVPFLLRHLPLPDAPEISFDRRFIEAVCGRMGEPWRVSPGLVIERLSVLPMTSERANLLVETACERPELFAVPEVCTVMAAADPINPVRLAGVLQLDEALREAALRHLGRRATDALGSRLDARSWTVGDLLAAANGLLAEGVAPADVAQAAVNRLPRVGAEDHRLAELLDWLEQRGVVGKALFKAALGFASRPESAYPEVLSKWLSGRMKSSNAWKEHGTPLFAATLFTNGLLLEDVLRGVLRWPRTADEPARVLGAVKMAFGRLLLTEVKVALVDRRADDVRDLLLALGTLAAPEGLSKSVNMLRHCEGVVGEVEELLDACVSITRRAGSEADEVGDVDRALGELRPVGWRRHDRITGRLP